MVLALGENKSNGKEAMLTGYSPTSSEETKSSGKELGAETKAGATQECDCGSFNVIAP